MKKAHAHLHSRKTSQINKSQKSEIVLNPKIQDIKEKYRKSKIARKIKIVKSSSLEILHRPGKIRRGLIDYKPRLRISLFQ